MQQSLKDRHIAIIYGGFIKRGGGVVTHLNNLEILLKGMGAIAAVFTFDNVPIYISYPIVFIERFFNILTAPLGYRIRFALTKIYWTYHLPRYFDWYFFEDIYSIPNNFQEDSHYNAFVHALKSDNLQKHKCINHKQLTILFGEEKQLIEKHKNKILVVSAETAIKIEKQFLVDELNVFTNFIPYDIKPTPWNKKENLILFVGNLDVNKNPLFLLNVAQKLKNDNIQYKLIFIGDGPLKVALKKQAVVLKLENYIDILGRINHGQVLEYMARAKILALPSIYESSPFVLLEAKSSGCVTICRHGLNISSSMVDYAISTDQHSSMNWAHLIQNIFTTSEFAFNNQHLKNCSIKAIQQILLNLINSY